MPDNRFTRYKVEAWDILQHLFKVKNINDHTLHFVATFSGKLDLDRFRQAVNLSADAFPLIRSRFNETEGQPYWEDKGYTTEDMLEFSETHNMDESVAQFINKEVNAFNGPQLRLKVIRNDKNDTLCVSMNHMLCDAAGFKNYLYMLSDIYLNMLEKPNCQSAAMGNRKIRQLLRAFSIRDKIKIMFSKNDMSTHDPAKFKFEGDLNNPFIEMRTISQEGFCLLKTYAKEHDATVNDVILTAYMRVLYQLFGRTIIIPCAVDLRKYLPKRRVDGICNLVTNP